MDEQPEIRPVRSDAEYQASLRVRIQVFVTEQGGPLADEPDAWDPISHHFVLLAEGEIVGAGRVYHPEAEVSKLGRICLLPEYRGRGWGEMLVGELLRYAQTLGTRRILLDAQAYALPFYKRFGFRPVGEEFLEGGIVHQRMEWSIASSA